MGVGYLISIKSTSILLRKFGSGVSLWDYGVLRHKYAILGEWIMLGLVSCCQ